MDTKSNTLDKCKANYPGRPKNGMQHNSSVGYIFAKYSQLIRLFQFQL